MTPQQWQDREQARAFAGRIAVLTRMASHLEDVDTATSGVSDMLLILARQGDSTLVALDEDENLVGATDDGDDLLDELTTIDRARRNAWRILRARGAEPPNELGA